MANKHKGSNNERELLKIFSESGWRAARVAGSGVNDDSPCDLIAGKSIIKDSGHQMIDDEKIVKKFAIECKSTRKTTQYISKEQISDFIIFSEMMGLDPIIAVKFLREGWLFVEPKQLRDCGKNWAIKLEDAKIVGKRFGQLTG